MKLKALGDRVILKVIEQKEKKLPSGLYVPETAQEKSIEAEVIDIGEDESIKVKPGDIVVYDKYSGTEIEIDNEKYLIIKYKDILAKLEK
ncbi:MAG: co-chaperone GroES [Candidatus Woesearchaeota archaeon]